MRKIGGILIVMSMAVIVLADEKDDVKGEGDKLIGTWIVQKAERNEKEAKEVEGSTYQFKDGKMTMRPRDPKADARTATYKIRGPGATGKPMRIVFTPEDGPNKGREMQGIFRFKDGVLELCHCTVPLESKGFEPADFVTKPGSGWILMTLKKEE